MLGFSSVLRLLQLSWWSRRSCGIDPWVDVTTSLLPFTEEDRREAREVHGLLGDLRARRHYRNASINLRVSTHVGAARPFYRRTGGL